MRYVATAAILGLAGTWLGSVANADQLGIQPAMLNNNTASVSATTGFISGALKAVSEIPAIILAPSQTMLSSMPTGASNASDSRRLGVTTGRPDAADAVPHTYGTHLSGQLKSVGTAGHSDTPAAASVPNSWQLSITPNAARTSLVGLAPSDRALTK